MSTAQADNNTDTTVLEELILETPIKIDGKEVKVLKFKPALGKHIKFLANSKKGDGDKIWQVTCQLNQNGLTPHLLDELPAASANEITNFVGELLGGEDENL